MAMTQPSKSLFVNLYINLLMSISLVLIFYGLLYAFFEYTSEIDDFVGSTQQALRPIEASLNEHPDNTEETIDKVANIFDFDIRILSREDKVTLLAHSEYIDETNNPKVFHFRADGIEEKGLRAVYEINAAQYLVISDRVDLIAFEEESINQDEDTVHNREQALFYMIFFLILITIPFAIYFPVKKLTTHVNSLVLTSRRFGQGNLSVRADEALPNPVCDIAKGFNQMANELQRSLKEQEIMTHAMAHELRTPLSKIELALGILESREMDSMAVELVGNLQDYSYELDELTDNLLTLAQLNSLQNISNPTSINVSALLEERSRLLQDLELSKVININTHPQAFVIGEPFHLQLAFDNLIKNALKYAHSKINIGISVSNKKTHITIEDDGPGVPNNMKDSVFLPFTRVDESRARDTGNYGLGLAIVANIIRYHHAKINLQDSDLGGAKFTLTFTNVCSTKS